ncbi:DarT ssDNA thymidine ADP-ribosyltransferase family protein [uncultured Fusobacterium sp.]|uniref:DarT ssDNA thymidine ADP-ribosyltransferase family protein n=1 Tax=uncultured Fusobacterium sp. TaxID=159267 RepID=UPI0015A62D68|nr:DarT ssDNA thymidine ADP-ribosyltransferase family protein [uncultured Fusobacterium sp.]
MGDIHLTRVKVLERIVKVLDKYNYTYNIIFMKGTQSKYQINVTANEDHFKIDVFIKIGDKKNIVIDDKNEKYKFLLQEFGFSESKVDNLYKEIKLAREILEKKLRVLQDKEIICEVDVKEKYIQVRDTLDKAQIVIKFYKEKISLQGSESEFFHMFFNYLEGKDEEIFDYFKRNNMILEKLLNNVESKRWKEFSSNKDYSQEQLDVIDAQENIVIVNACAGSGKTTVLEGLINKHCNSQILYLVYNKAIQMELQERFKKYKNVKVLTSHSMAYEKSTGNVSSGLNLFEVADKMGLNFLDTKYIIEVFQKYIIDSEKDLNKFLTLYESELKYLYSLIQFKFYVENHKEELANLKNEEGYIDREKFFERVKEVPELKMIDDYFASMRKRTKRLIKELMELIDSEKIKEPHDYYLKKFQIEEGPTNKYDIVMVDEAQDSNGVLIDILDKKFPKAKKIIVGDTYQQIYSWRGAINSLEYFLKFEGAKRYDLTNSYRIGRELGSFCTEVTELRDNKGLNIKGNNKNQKIVGFEEVLKSDDEKTTILFRKNLNMVNYALGSDKKILFLKEFNMEKIRDFLRFKEGKKEEITELHYLKRYKDYNQLEEFLDKDLESNSEILMYRNLVNAYPENLEELLDKLEDRIISDKELEKYASDEVVILGTIHSSKGKEFKKLIIYIDILENMMSGFLNIDELKEEINLFYVALTRSKGKLYTQYELDSNLIKILARSLGKDIQNLKNYLRIENIKKLVSDRKIENILHFTSIGNIKGILEKGIISRKRLEDKNKYYVSSDDNRFDNMYDYISTSISFPNYKMFYKKRIENDTNIYVVIALKPDILWEKDCLFMPTNAASYKEIPNSFSSDVALNNMFDLDNPKHLSFTKDVQAEVLVKNEIGLEYIKAIYFEKEEHRQEFYRKIERDIDGIECIVDRTYFNKRDF